MNPQLRKLVERLKALKAQQTEMVSAAEKEDRDFTDDEKTKFDALQSEVTEVTARKERLEDLLKNEINEPTVATFDGGDTVDSKIVVKQPNFVQDPKKGFRDHTEYLNGVIKCTRAGKVEDPRLRFLVTDREGKAIHQVGTDGQVVDHIGQPVNITAGSDEHGMYADPYGGFFVPEAFVPGPMMVMPEADPIGGMVTRVPMTAPIVRINARVDKDHSSSVSGGFQWYRRAEADTVTATRGKYEQVKLEAESLQGISYATNELLAASPVSFAAIIAAGFRTELPNKLTKERLNGTGVGEFEGIRVSGAKVQITKETGQAADTIVYENLVKARARCWNYQQAVWLYNHDCLPQLMTMTMDIGTGGVPVWQTNARDGEPDLLLGRPAYASEYCQTVGDAGDILLAVWSEYLEGTYMPFETAESIHVRFVENETAFRATMMNAGACWWRSALTPAVSTTTLSPVVELKARA